MNSSGFHNSPFMDNFLIDALMWIISFSVISTKRQRVFHDLSNILLIFHCINNHWRTTTINENSNGNHKPLSWISPWLQAGHPVAFWLSCPARRRKITILQRDCICVCSCSCFLSPLNCLSYCPLFCVNIFNTFTTNTL